MHWISINILLSKGNVAVNYFMEYTNLIIICLLLRYYWARKKKSRAGDKHAQKGSQGCGAICSINDSQIRTATG